MLSFKKLINPIYPSTILIKTIGIVLLSVAIAYSSKSLANEILNIPDELRAYLKILHEIKRLSHNEIAIISNYQSGSVVDKWACQNMFAKFGSKLSLNDCKLITNYIVINNIHDPVFTIQFVPTPQPSVSIIEQ